MRSGAPATSRIFGSPQGLFEDGSNNLYVAEVNGGRIDRIASGTAITTIVAGNGGFGFSGDGGPALGASFSAPRYVTLDSGGNIYIADSDRNCVVRRVDASTGVISTFAGIPGQCGYNGDNIPAYFSSIRHLPTRACFR